MHEGRGGQYYKRCARFAFSMLARSDCFSHARQMGSVSASDKAPWLNMLEQTARFVPLSQQSIMWYCLRYTADVVSWTYSVQLGGRHISIAVTSKNQAEAERPPNVQHLLASMSKYTAEVCACKYQPRLTGCIIAGRSMSTRCTCIHLANEVTLLELSCRRNVPDMLHALVDCS